MKYTALLWRAILPALLFTFTANAGNFTVIDTHCICNQGSKGAIVLEVSNTSQEFTFEWHGPNGYASTEQNPEDITRPGEYVLWVTNSVGCTILTDVEVKIEMCPTLQPVQITGGLSSCGDGAVGELHSYTAGGTGQLSYEWTNGSSEPHLFNVSPGIYGLTVTDEEGCMSETDIHLHNPGDFSVSLETAQDCICEGETAFPFHIATVGEPASDFRIEWSGPGGFVSGSTSPAITVPGQYTVTVTDPANCQTILTPDEIAACPGMTLGDIHVEMPSGCGESDGSIRMLSGVNGGTWPFTFSLSDDTGGLMPLNPYGGWSNLQTGIYTLSITDANNCSVEEVFTLVPDPEGIVIAGEVNPVCYGGNNGEIHVLGTSSLSERLRYTWNTGEVFTPEELTEPVVLTGLSPGDYSVTVSFASGVFPDCAVAKDFTVEELQASETLTFSNIDYTPTICPDEPNSGYMSVTMEGGTLDPQYGNYTYEWSTPATGSTASGLSTGQYCVTVTDYCGQSAVTCREIISDDDFEIMITGGLFMPGQESTPLIAFIRIGDGSWTTEFPEGYNFLWNVNQGEYLLGNTNPLILPSSYAENGGNVALYTTRGCAQKLAEQPIYVCGDEGATSFFVVDEFRPCLGGANGEIHLSIPNLFGADVSVFYGDENEELDLTLLPNLDVVTMKGQLLAGTHRFTVVINDCAVSFDYELQLSDPETEFVSFEESTGNCIYQDFCGDIPLGQFATDSWLDPMNGTKNPCQVPQLCGDEIVNWRPYGKRKCRGLVYRQLVLQLADSPYFTPAYIDILLGSPISDCEKVKFCTGNMKYTRKWGWGGPATPNGFSVNGCPKFTCGDFLQTNFRVCPDDECVQIPNYTLDPDPPVANTCSEYESFNVYGLLYALDQGWLADAHNFPGSELEGFLLGLSEMTQTEQDKAKCAIAIFCKDDYELFYHNFEDQDCSNVLVTNVSDDVDFITVGEWSEDEDWSIDITSVQVTSVSTCNLIDTITDPLTGNVIRHVARCKRPDCDSSDPLNFADCLSEVEINYQDLFDVFGVQPFAPTEEQNFTLFSDPFGIERVVKLSTLNYQGYTLPKAILETPSGRAYYDFTPGNNVESKLAEAGLEYHIEDWDTETSLMVLSNSQGGYRLIYETMTQSWDKILYTTPDAVLDLKNVQVDNLTGDVEISGFSDGALYLMGNQLLSEVGTKLFSVKLSTLGEVIDLKTASGVNAELIKGSSFSNDGGHLLVSEFGDNLSTIELEGQTISANSAQSGVRQGIISVFDAIEGGYVNIKRIGMQGQSRILESASSTEGNYSLLVENTESIERSFSYDYLFVENVEKTLLASITPDGNIEWEVLIEGTDFPLYDVVQLPNNEVFLALTFSNSFQVGGQVFQSQGGYDVALLRFSATGNLVWGESYGTSEDELVQQLYYNGYDMFFVGEFWGDVFERTLGERTFRDYSPNNNEVYISYIHLGEETYGLDEERNGEYKFPGADLSKEKKAAIVASIYPNPSTSDVFLDLNSFGDDRLLITLETPLGQEITSWNYQIAAGSNTLILNIPNIPQGMYLISIKSENSQEVLTTKFVRE